MGPPSLKKNLIFLIFLFDNYIYSVILWDMYNSNIERINNE